MHLRMMSNPMVPLTLQVRGEGGIQLNSEHSEGCKTLGLGGLSYNTVISLEDEGLSLILDNMYMCTTNIIYIYII